MSRHTIQVYRSDHFPLATSTCYEVATQDVDRLLAYAGAVDTGLAGSTGYSIVRIDTGSPAAAAITVN